MYTYVVSKHKSTSNLLALNEEIVGYVEITKNHIVNGKLYVMDFMTNRNNFFFLEELYMYFLCALWAYREPDLLAI